MALSLRDFPYFDLRGWGVSPDHWNAVLQARYVYYGATGAIYENNFTVSALPGLPILYAPAVALGDHVGLVQGYPYVIPHPTMWLLIGPEAFAIGSVMVWGVDALVAQLGVSSFRRRALTIALAAFVVIPVVQTFGHPEDCAATGLVCFALTAHLRGEYPRVGWWLSAAILMQSWALLACPLLLLATPAGRRFGVAVRAALFPAAVFLLCLAGTSSATWRQVVSQQPMPTDGQFTPWYAIATHLHIPHYRRVVGASSRRWGTVVAILIGLTGLRRPSGRLVVGATAAVFLIRPLFETSDWGYFSMPGLVMATVLAATSRRRLWYVLLGAAVVLAEPSYGLWYFPEIDKWTFLAILILTNGSILAAAVLLTRRTADARISVEQPIPDAVPAIV